MSTLAAPLSLTIGRVMQSGQSVNDASSTHRLQLIAAGLALLGIVLIGFTIWYWRASRPEHQALAPLEVMSDRKWRSADTGEQRRSLDEVRAPDSPVLAPALSGAPPDDLAVLAAARELPSIDDHAGFGDLVEASVTPEGEPHAEPADDVPPAVDEPPVNEPAVAEPDGRRRPDVAGRTSSVVERRRGRVCPWPSRRSTSLRGRAGSTSRRSTRRRSALDAEVDDEPAAVEPAVDEPVRVEVPAAEVVPCRAGARRRVTSRSGSDPPSPPCATFPRTRSLTAGRPTATVQRMATFDVDAMITRFRERAAAVKRRPLPPVAGEERQQFLQQAQEDFQDFAMIGDATASIDDGVLVLRVDLRPPDARN